MFRILFIASILFWFFSVIKVELIRWISLNPTGSAGLWQSSAFWEGFHELNEVSNCTHCSFAGVERLGCLTSLHHNEVDYPSSGASIFGQNGEWEAGGFAMIQGLTFWNMVLKTAGKPWQICSCLACRMVVFVTESEGTENLRGVLFWGCEIEKGRCGFPVTQLMDTKQCSCWGLAKTGEATELPCKTMLNCKVWWQCLRQLRESSS